MILLYNCTYVHFGPKTSLWFLKNEHFISGPGNRRVTLYTVDALLVPRVFTLLTLACTSMHDLYY